MTSQAPLPCPCKAPDVPRRFIADSQSLGVDETLGRYADASIRECSGCGQPWAHYQVEYESFSRSGRWARGKISRERARTITAQEVADHIDAHAPFICGGSYFDGEESVRSVQMPWGISGWDNLPDRRRKPKPE